MIFSLCASAAVSSGQVSAVGFC